MLTSRENFFQMMRHERPQWLPFDLPATPPVLDMIESKTGTRDVVKAFGTDFCGCGPTFPVDPACWSDAFEALGFPVPANAEIGVDILNPVQPECMPVVEVIAQHKHHLAFWGMIGTQTTMPFGSPDDVRAAARRVRALRAGRSGGHRCVHACVGARRAVGEHPGSG